MVRRSRYIGLLTSVLFSFSCCERLQGKMVLFLVLVGF